MSRADALSTVRRSLETIADSLDALSFVVPRPGRAAAEADRRALVETVRRYVLQRLREPDAPVVAVLVGLSGVGKSTILNSLAQDAVSESGVVRPTTTRGVLWAHRDHAARYWTEFVGRVRDQIGPATDVVIGDDPLTRHLTLVDTPPLESRPQGAAAAAEETLMFADICVFVTSAERYADAAPLRFLDAARARGIPILFVLNRLPPGDAAAGELRADFVDKLVAAGHLPEPDPAFVFAVEEAAQVRRHGGLAPEAVAPVRKELSEISDPDFRLVVIDDTAEATVHAVADRALSLAARARRERADREHLRSRAHDVYEEAGRRLAKRLRAGDFAHLARHEVWAQASLDLAGLATHAAGAAAAEVAEEWESHPGGRGLLEAGHEGLRRHGPDAAAAVRSEADAWFDGLPDLIAAGRKRKPRSRKMRRLVDELWRTVVDPGRPPHRRHGPDAETADRARRLLSQRLKRGLTADGERFDRRLGPVIDPDVAARVAEAAAYLLEIPEASERPPAMDGAAHGE